jgi:NADH-quinone oxidoreductase subunit H
MPYLVLIFKVLFMCVFAIGIRGTVPRYRYDQLSQLNWKHFIFLWISFLIFNILINILYFF